MKLALAVMLAMAAPGLAAPALAAPALAKTPVRSGSYGGSLLLYVDGDVVQGVFHDQRGGVFGVPQFDCIFQLRGTLRDGEADIVTWYPGQTIEAPIAGHLSLGAGDATFKLQDEPGGCAMTDGDMTHEPYDNGGFVPEPRWIGVGLIASRHVSLRSAPGAAAPKYPYLTDGDAVAILARRQGWVRVRYQQTEHPVEGWLRASDIAPDTPPAP